MDRSVRHGPGLRKCSRKSPLPWNERRFRSDRIQREKCAWQALTHTRPRITDRYPRRTGWPQAPVLPRADLAICKRQNVGNGFTVDDGTEPLIKRPRLEIALPYVPGELLGSVSAAPSFRLRHQRP